MNETWKDVESFSELLIDKEKTNTENLAEVKALGSKESSMGVNAVAMITEDMSVVGDININGSIEINGSVNGNVSSNDLIKVGGEIHGNLNANTIHLESAVVAGNINFVESVEVSKDSIIVGDIKGDKNVNIAGSIKGNIDIREEIVLLTGAVIVGDIKCKNIRIESGVSIKGSVDQCYSDVDIEALFGDY